MGATSAKPAIPPGDDAEPYTAVLAEIHEAMTHGGRPPARPREVIGDSWSRARRQGLSPDRRLPEPSSGDPGRHDPHDRLARLVPSLAARLAAVLEDDALLLVVSDAAGRVMAREGGPGMRSRADDIGFAPGAAWTEREVGTNAIGTALAVRRSVQVHGPEHFLIAQHGWSCAAAPIRDPRGGLLGVVDLSSTVADSHPVLIATAELLAQAAEAQLASAQRRGLERLRASAASLTPAGRDWLLVDGAGWVAASSDPGRVRRVALPDALGVGSAWIPPLGDCLVEEADGGWLLSGNAGSAPDEPATLRLPREGESAAVLISSTLGRSTVRMSPRQIDILRLLAEHPHGLSASRLSMLLYGTHEHDVTVRAEISRIRRSIGGVILTAPYRFADGLDILP